MRLKTWHILLLGLLIFAWYGGYIKFETQSIATVTQTETAALEGVAVNKPLLISVVDPIAGQSVASATVKIYDGTTLMETLTTGSNGQVTTAMPYPSGKRLNIYIESGNSKKWVTITVPYMNQADAQATSTNYVTLPFFTLGTYSIKVIDQFGNVYTSGGTLNFTTLGSDTVSLTIQIYNTQDNTGYESSHDPISNVDWKAVFRAYATNPSFIVSGFERNVERGTTSYYLKVIPDDGLIRQKVGTQYVKPGVYTFTITLQKGSLAAGSSEVLTLDLFAYFDPNYFATTGIGSNDQLQLATFTLNIAA